MTSQKEIIELSPVETGEQDQNYKRRWWTLAVLCSILLLITVEDTIVSVALPTLAVELAASASELQWIVEAYILVLAGLLLTGGSLSDRFGNRNMLLTGLVVFGVTSVASSFAPSVPFLIAARAVMGVGAALIMPATLAIIRNTFEAKERPLAMGIWVSVASLGIVLGPLLGGWLLEHFWWGAIFLINVPPVLLVFAVSFGLLPRSPLRLNTPIDFVGTLLSVAGIGSLVFGIIEAPTLGWTNLLTIGLMVLGGLLLAGFVFWELHTPHPMLDLRLFRNPRFSVASLSVALVYFALFGTMFFLTQHLQFVLGYSPLEAGLRTIPVAGAVTVAGLLSPWLTSQLGTKLVVFAGLAITAVGLFVFSTVTLNSGYDLVVVMLVIAGFGIGLAAIPAADSVMGAVPKTQSGSAGSVDETAIQLGGALGIAVLGSALAASYTDSLNASKELVAGGRTEATESIGSAVRLAAEIGGTEGQNLLLLARTAFVEAMGNTVLLGAGVALLGAFVALIFLPARETKET